ncbi:MAG: 5-(carboxyamino)imidazole ribonucleotide mutase [Saprospiraceae bacterium]|nr:5-(carboxyamino)imidazole ribonucleotide mutase [Saprospiraceae bacterium]
MKKVVSIIMGSDSDLPVMRQAAEVLEELNIGFELTIISAHRTPERMMDFAKKAHQRGIKAIVAGAGGAAHLPGMVAAISPLPVVGVPIKSSNSIDGWDSILSILQMPGGVPVATVALNGAKNAGILAAQIVGSSDQDVLERIVQYKEKLRQAVEDKYNRLEEEGYKNYKK